MSSIVVGLLGAMEHEPAVDFAVEEALRRRLPLEVVHTFQIPLYVETPSALYAETLSAARTQARALTEAALQRAEQRVPGGHKVRAHLVVREGDPAQVLLTAAQDAALLVVGTRGASAVQRGVLGSASAACLHRSHTPVAVVPHHAHVFYDKWLTSRVVVAVDGSPAATTALAWAVAQAHEWSCALTPVVVSPSYNRAPAALETQRQELGTELPELVSRLVAEAGGHGLEVRPHFLVGDPATELLRFLDPADLLVMGSRGHAALTSLLLGSTSLAVAESAPSPVVVVRAGEARRELRSGVQPVPV